MSQMIPFQGSGQAGAFTSMLMNFASSPAGRQALSAMASEAGKRGRRMIDRTLANLAGPTKGGAVSLRGLRVSSKPKSKKKRGGKRGSTRTNSSSGLYVSVKSPSDTRIRMTFRDVQAVTTDGAGTVSQYWQIAYNDASGHDFRTWLPKAATIGGIFDYFKVRSLRVKFKPGTGYTSTGNLCLAVSDDAAAGAPSSLQTLIHADPSILSDVKTPCEVVWRPSGTAENVDHWTNLGSGAVTNATAPVISFGTVLFYAPTTSVVSGTLGYLEFECDVEFYGLESL